MEPRSLSDPLPPEKLAFNISGNFRLSSSGRRFPDSIGLPSVAFDIRLERDQENAMFSLFTALSELLYPRIVSI
jgi:hypothetical protein